MRQDPNYYSIIQYCHNFLRCENVNIGLVIWSPKIGLSVQINDDLSRVTKLFTVSSFDMSCIKCFAETLQTRLEASVKDWISVDDFDSFTKSLANNIHMTPPRWTKSGKTEGEFRLLFKALVK